MSVFGRDGPGGRLAYFVGLSAGCLLLAACANPNVATPGAPETDSAIRPPPTQRAAKRTAPARRSLVRKATAAGRRRGRYSVIGLASWYGPRFHGRTTADGETFDMNSLTAANRTLPLPCRVRVTNLANHRSIMVRVNDRGPYVGSRVIDVSARSAKLLGFYRHGLAKVKVDYIGRAPLKSAAYRRPAGG